MGITLKRQEFIAGLGMAVMPHASSRKIIWA
jgi:hypothetical protein